MRREETETWPLMAEADWNVSVNQGMPRTAGNTRNKENRVSPRVLRENMVLSTP